MAAPQIWKPDVVGRDDHHLRVLKCFVERLGR